MFLLCVLLLYVLIDDIIPLEQTGFRPNRSCCDQVMALTTHRENGYDRNVKTALTFIELSSAYDTVWRKGLLSKFSNSLRIHADVRLNVDRLRLKSRKPPWKNAEMLLPENTGGNAKWLEDWMVESPDG
ncbi:Reverse transcriptase domain [Cinara cedri]|uniref:Reverse transcriptase domain n=1 Tax=Cinara cedri TaxID=506608 RepID=A0A5E4MYQ2_9HEMI|nr:Reverse transcriptase domain [Cinara cedri]